MSRPIQPDHLLDRLEHHYDFQCVGGPLKNCIEWQALRSWFVTLGSAQSVLKTLAVELAMNPYPRSQERAEAVRATLLHQGETS